LVTATVYAERAYVARVSGRVARERAMETCHTTRDWTAKARGK